MPEEPTAVLITGADTSGHSAVLGALVGRFGPVADQPSGCYVVVRHDPAGPSYTVASIDPAGTPPRPPRRVDVGLPALLLRHVVLVGAPAVDGLGPAGIRILVDVAGRGGAAVYVVRCGDRPGHQDTVVLTALVHGGVAVFFAVTPDEAGRWRGPAGVRTRNEKRDDAEPDDAESAAVAVHAYRQAVAAAVPALSDAPWHTVDPPAADATYLRQALTDWAGGESLRRAADDPPVTRGTIVVPAVGSGWRARLDQAHRGVGYAIRHDLAVELTGLHLRYLRQAQRYREPASLLRALDDELHALSLRSSAVTDAALAQMFHEVLHAIYAGAVPDAAQQGFHAAVRNRVAADQIIQALLVTAAGAVVAVPGRAAVAALCAYPAHDDRTLSGTGVALAGDCWDARRTWGPHESRPFVERIVNELETALSRQAQRRFDTVRQALRTVVGEAVHAGILMT